jgi:hypothetical protein
MVADGGWESVLAIAYRTNIVDKADKRTDSRVCEILSSLLPLEQPCC